MALISFCLRPRDQLTHSTSPPTCAPGSPGSPGSNTTYTSQVRSSIQTTAHLEETKTIRIQAAATGINIANRCTKQPNLPGRNKFRHGTRPFAPNRSRSCSSLVKIRSTAPARIRFASACTRRLHPKNSTNCSTLVGHYHGLDIRFGTCPDSQPSTCVSPKSNVTTTETGAIPHPKELC